MSRRLSEVFVGLFLSTIFVVACQNSKDDTVKVGKAEMGNRGDAEAKDKAAQKAQGELAKKISVNNESKGGDKISDADLSAIASIDAVLCQGHPIFKELWKKVATAEDSKITNKDPQSAFGYAKQALSNIGLAAKSTTKDVNCLKNENLSDFFMRVEVQDGQKTYKLSGRDCRREENILMEAKLLVDNKMEIIFKGTNMSPGIGRTNSLLRGGDLKCLAQRGEDNKLSYLKCDSGLGQDSTNDKNSSAHVVFDVFTYQSQGDPQVKLSGLSCSGTTEVVSKEECAKIDVTVPVHGAIDIIVECAKDSKSKSLPEQLQDKEVSAVINLADQEKATSECLADPTKCPQTEAPTVTNEQELPADKQKELEDLRAELSEIKNEWAGLTEEAKMLARAECEGKTDCETHEVAMDRIQKRITELESEARQLVLDKTVKANIEADNAAMMEKVAREAQERVEKLEINIAPEEGTAPAAQPTVAAPTQASAAVDTDAQLEEIIVTASKSEGEEKSMWQSVKDTVSGWWSSFKEDQKEKSQNTARSNLELAKKRAAAAGLDAEGKTKE